MTDRSGEVLVIEPQAEQLKVKRNPVKVMTNSPERFVRMVYLLEYTKQASSTNEGLLTLLNLLGNVKIPKGVDVERDGIASYTQYIALFNTQVATYYIQPVNSNRLFSLQLDEELLNQPGPKVFPFLKDVTIEILNR